MEGVRINPDKKHVELIISGLQKKDGYCPCKVGKLEENICPCDDFVKTKHCHCKLYIEE